MRLRLERITKSFPEVKALQEVDFDLAVGEIHALCGENGAGKTTLINILAGNIRPDSGHISLEGENVVIKSPYEAVRRGVAVVHQHLSLFDSLTVAENMLASKIPVNGIGLIQYKDLYSRAEALLNKLEMTGIDASSLVASLSPGEKQMVEIAKALACDPTILVLDEPTASLTSRECTVLFSLLENLKSQGKSIIYISHRMDEVFLLADRITVLKDGVSQGTSASSAFTKDQLIRKMVGRDIQSLKRGPFVSNDVLLSIRNISGKRFEHVTFDVHKGEIVGLAGLVGAGRTEIARAIFGADEIQSGEIFLRGESLRFRHANDGIRKGIGYLPEDRRAQGLFPEMSIAENVAAGADIKLNNRGFFDIISAGKIANVMREKLRIASPDIHTKVTRLSGGNQQKVLIARWMVIDPDVLMVDEPTHGVDVGGKFEIHNIFRSLAAEGKGLIVISSELPELLGLCDRILVIKDGRVAAEFSAADATEEKIVSVATTATC
jgi:ABC-type sugar transport system ATPase subunit